jgi:hypothetical protein
VQRARLLYYDDKSNKLRSKHGPISRLHANTGCRCGVEAVILLHRRQGEVTRSVARSAHSREW